MPYDLASVHGCASAQRGLVTRRQLLGMGVPSRTIGHWLERGLLISVARGVYLLMGSPIDWHARLLAECLAHGGLASHLSAGVVFGLGVPKVRPEVVVPSSRRGPIGGTVHRVARFDEMDPRRVDGIPVVGPLPLVSQFAGLVPERLSLDRFEGAVWEMVRQGLTTWSELDETAATASRKRLAGVGHLRQVIELNSDGCDSPPERELLRLLRSRGLPEPVRQFEVTLRDGTRFRLDHAYPAPMVALEVDSVRHHFSQVDVQRDKRRRDAIRLEGWLVFEVTVQRMRRHATALLDQVERALIERTP